MTNVFLSGCTRPLQIQPNRVYHNLRRTVYRGYFGKYYCFCRRKLRTSRKCTVWYMICLLPCRYCYISLIYPDRCNITPLTYIRVCIARIYYRQCIGYYISSPVTVRHHLTAQMFKRHLKPLFRPCKAKRFQGTNTLFIYRQKNT